MRLHCHLEILRYAQNDNDPYGSAAQSAPQPLPSSQALRHGVVAGHAVMQFERSTWQNGAQ